MSPSCIVISWKDKMLNQLRIWYLQYHLNFGPMWKVHVQTRVSLQIVIRFAPALIWCYLRRSLLHWKSYIINLVLSASIIINLVLFPSIIIHNESIPHWERYAGNFRLN
eukprot:44964_1